MAAMVVRRAGIDMNKRAGELSTDEVAKLVAVLENPAGFDLPEWTYNRQKDRDTGKSMHLVSSAVDTALRNDLERLKRNRVHRGLRHHWRLRVRGQHMNSNSRHRH
jgi:small subunit ribosomal protein S18e